MADNKGDSALLLAEIQDTHNAISEQSAILASRVSLVDVVRANGGDVEEAKEAVKAQEIEVGMLQAHLLKLKQRAGQS